MSGYAPEGPGPGSERRAGERPGGDAAGTDGDRPVRVVVADDQTAIREALAVVLDLQPGLDVVATARDGAEAVAAAAEHAPDVILMDLNMPRTDGVEATRQVTERFPDVAVVVLTTLSDEQDILAALGAGARGYLTKESGRQDIARAVRAAAAGQAVLDPAVQERLLAAAVKSAAPVERPGAGLAPDLTPRETEVLTLIGEGLTNRGIAERLVVSEATVKTHINNLFAKAQLRDRAHAVKYAFLHGLVRARG
ncbi:putative two-component system response regulator [Actinacidiphila reveromycinica]|uniref:Putative two-component system response regulator n=1 Tax=Actinacidiphila reveromycinica TaxID=659352 RepID=A0A7U3UWW0_9ACTN|nr:response regulator transcription factor [Streptomyces sp. SN-593]BBB01731.1 putative two-component system response regulator [Streptomyces sp. SN-593]